MPLFISSSEGPSPRGQAARRRGFRILLWAVGLFWLAQILSGLVLDYLWMRPRYPRMADMFARVKARDPAPEIIFLGSSRFERDVNEAVLDAELRRQFGDKAPRTFNASLPCGDPTVFERVFDEMCRGSYRPKLVVVEINPSTLAGRDNWLHQHALNVLDWRDVPEAAPALCRNGRIMFLINGRLLPLYTHRYHICKEALAWAQSLFCTGPDCPVAAPPAAPEFESDPAPPIQTPAMLAAMEHGSVDISKELRNYRVGGVVTRRLERLLERCQLAGIKVILVGVPVSSPSRRACTPEVCATFLDYMHQLTARYGCSFTDWRDQIPDAYFVDTHHVSFEGGVYFSRRFATSVLGWSPLVSFGGY